jgi:hypothetical protein
MGIFGSQPGKFRRSPGKERKTSVVSVSAVRDEPSVASRTTTARSLSPSAYRPRSESLGSHQLEGGCHGARSVAALSIALAPGPIARTRLATLSGHAGPFF